MKKYNYSILLAGLILVCLHTARAQNIAINSTGALPDSSALLDISGSAGGILIPRLTSTQISSITRPAKGLMVFNSSTNSFQVNTGTATAPSWSTLFSTNNSSSGIGSVDTASVRITTYNIPRITIDSAGNVGVGNAPVFTPSNKEKFLIDAGTTTSINLMSAKASINNYLQLNIQNKSTGANASSDVVATADNGDESNNYVDLGINSSGYNAGFFGSANDAYLFNIGQNFLIGTGSTGKSLIFLTGGGDQATNERMRISSGGNVGISNTNPLSTLDNNGSTGFAITTTSSSLTLDDSHHTVIITGGTPTITLPTASTSARRIYVIVNQTGANRTISSYKNMNGANSTKVAANSSVALQSDGSNWYQIQ